MKYEVYDCRYCGHVHLGCPSVVPGQSTMFKPFQHCGKPMRPTGKIVDKMTPAERDLAMAKVLQAAHDLEQALDELSLANEASDEYHRLMGIL